MVRARGFTIIELSVVLVIAGLVVAGAAELYRVYAQGQKLEVTQDHLKTIDSSISSYFAARGQYPCPADPALPIDDANAGIEQRDAVSGQCVVSGGAVEVNGARDANGDGTIDRILIGAVPYKTLKIAQDTDTAGNFIGSNAAISGASGQDALDGWQNRIVYAVTKSLTRQATYSQVYGAISVRTEGGTQLTNPDDSAHMVLVAPGANGVGAYRPDGTIGTACGAGTADDVNCDNNAIFVAGLINEVPGATYFDDSVYFRSMTSTSLWDIVPDPTIIPPAIYNTNPRNVGIGLASGVTPIDKLTIAGGAMKAFGTESNKLCNSASAGGSTLGKCFDVSLLADTGTYCSQPGGNQIRLMTGLKNNAVTCSPTLTLPSTISPTTCPAGKYMVGFNLFGQIICDTP